MKTIKIKTDQTHIDPCLGKYKSEEFHKLIENWAGELKNKSILKTDLREEAFGTDEILFSLTQDAFIYGVDIDQITVQQARVNQQKKNLHQKYIVSDVQNLGFADNVFDLILSTSTLDHFDTDEQLSQSLIELRRVLKPGGMMILAMNNKLNFNAYSMFKLETAIKLKEYRVKFYIPKQLKKIVSNAGFMIEAEDRIVHILSPLNSLFILGRKVLSEKFIDRLAKASVGFAHWLDTKKTKQFTAWFIVLKCIKPDN